MANDNALMAELANNIWKNYIRSKVENLDKDTMKFYRAEVVTNDGNNKLTIQRPYDEAYQVSCTDGMADATAGTQVLVFKFGNGTNNRNHLVVATGDGDFGSGGGSGTTIRTESVTVQTSAWNNKTATASVSNITSSSNIMMGYAESTWDVAVAAVIRVSAVGTNSITLKCENVPTAAVTLNLAIF